MPVAKEQENKRKARAKLWREFRQEFMLTQKDLAGLLGISRRQLQYIENAAFSPRKHTQDLFNTLYRTKHAEKQAVAKMRKIINA